MPYVADPWSNTTPTNANTVKDVVPAELIALKQVNLDRFRFQGYNITNETTVAASPVVTQTPVHYVQSALIRGAYNAALGEYTVDQAGWFRVAASLQRLGADNSYPANGPAGAGSNEESLIIQKYNLATLTWGNIERGAVVGTYWVPGAGVAGSPRLIMKTDATFQCLVGDKIRVIHEITSLTAFAAGVVLAPVNSPTETNSLFIEFLRAP
jgi:hypothetical protein